MENSGASIFLLQLLNEPFLLRFPFFVFISLFSFLCLIFVIFILSEIITISPYSANEHPMLLPIFIHVESLKGTSRSN